MASNIPLPPTSASTAVLNFRGIVWPEACLQLQHARQSSIFVEFFGQQHTSAFNFSIHSSTQFSWNCLASNIPLPPTSASTATYVSNKPLPLASACKAELNFRGIAWPETCLQLQHAQQSSMFVALLDQKHTSATNLCPQRQHAQQSSFFVQLVGQQTYLSDIPLPLTSACTAELNFCGIVWPATCLSNIPACTAELNIVGENKTDAHGTVWPETYLSNRPLPLTSACTAELNFHGNGLASNKPQQYTSASTSSMHSRAQQREQDKCSWN